MFVLCLGFYITPELLGGGKTIMVSMIVSRNVESTTNGARPARSAWCCWLRCSLIFSAVGRFIPLDRMLGQK